MYPLFTNISSVPYVCWALLCVLGVQSDNMTELESVLMMFILTCTFPIAYFKLTDCQNFNQLDDSIEYRNVMMFYDDGKFWIDGL